MRLGRRPVGLAWGDPPGRPVRPLFVVGKAEGIEVGLQPGEVGGQRPLPEPALEGLVEAFDLALGLGMTGCPILLPDAQVGEQILEPVPSPGEA